LGGYYHVERTTMNSNATAHEESEPEAEDVQEKSENVPFFSRKTGRKGLIVNSNIRAGVVDPNQEQRLKR
jgi:hypothetical protein